MRPLPPPEQKESRRHGEAAFPFQQYTTTLPPAAAEVFAHWHEEAEFALIQSGQCVYRIQLQEYAVRAGDLVFLPPALLHGISAGKGSMQSDTYVFHMHFLGLDARDLCATRYLLPLSAQELIPPYVISPDHPAYGDALALYHTVARAWQQQIPGYELLIRAKLLELKAQQHAEKISDIKGVQMKIEWGSQIRNYVFMPYTLVKDTRTGFENGNVQAVMDGDLDGFINAYLSMNAKH
jgi:hypothetical protein